MMSSMCFYKIMHNLINALLCDLVNLFLSFFVDGKKVKLDLASPKVHNAHAYMSNPFDGLVIK